jgi:ribonuclease HI
MILRFYFDGSHKNGYGAYAFVVLKDREVFYVGRGVLGRATSNEAEYEGAIAAVQFGNAAWPNVEKHLLGDSKLVVEQCQGRWRVKAKNLRPYHAKLVELLNQDKGWRVEWISRDFNELADAEAGALLQ